MRELEIIQSGGDNSEIDVFVAGVGYEERSRYCLGKVSFSVGQVIALRFGFHEVLEFATNLAFFQRREAIIVDGEKGCAVDRLVRETQPS